MEIYNIQQAAKKIGIHRNKLSERVQKNELKAIRYLMSSKEKIYIPEIFLKMNIEGQSKKIITFANIKGGVGKTTISVNFAYNLAFLGKKVLYIDFDAQANATRYLNSIPKDGDITIMDLIEPFIKQKEPELELILKSIKKIDFYNASLDLIPSRLSLSSMIEGVRSVSSMPHKILHKIFKLIKNKYDYIIIDTPPSPGISLQTAIYASDYISIVTDSEDFSVEGLKTLLVECKRAKDELDAFIKIDSIFVNKLENLSIHKVYIEEISEIAKNYNVPNIYHVPKLTRIKESVTMKIPLLEYKDDLDDEMRANESILSYALSKYYE